MKPRMILNAFDMSGMTHHTMGTWCHPSDQTLRYTDLDFWIDTAKELERGFFDCLFIADIVGVNDVYRGSAEIPLRTATHIPINDPFCAISAMASATKDLAFGITSFTTFEHPFALARRFSTLDHLTKGRIAWNVVSSYLDSAARNFGYDRQMQHDERYDMADEFMDVTYKLWEGSWEDDAVLRDRNARLFADASKVHPIRHKGKYFKVDGFHLCEPYRNGHPLYFRQVLLDEAFVSQQNTPRPCLFLHPISNRLVSSPTVSVTLRKRRDVHETRSKPARC